MSVDSINNIIEDCKKNNSIYQDNETNHNLLNHLGALYFSHIRNTNQLGLPLP